MQEQQHEPEAPDFPGSLTVQKILFTLLSSQKYCRNPASNGLVNVNNRKCRNEDCGKIPLFGVAGAKTAEYCAQHAPDRMVDVKIYKCRTECCGKIPLFEVAGTKNAE